MGYALSWIGVHGRPADTVLAELGWQRTGDQEDFPVSDGRVICAQLSSGWFVVVMIRSMDAYDGTIDASRLSCGGEVVACMLEEHVMASGFARWRDGQQVLGVEHDAQHSLRHLHVAGTLTPEMQEIIDEATRAQDEEDAVDADVDLIFDIPLDMAYRVTGYRHDFAELEGGQKYDVLEKLPRPKWPPRSWWSGLFGRRAV